MMHAPWEAHDHQASLISPRLKSGLNHFKARMQMKPPDEELNDSFEIKLTPRQQILLEKQRKGYPRNPPRGVSSWSKMVGYEAWVDKACWSKKYSSVPKDPRLAHIDRWVFFSFLGRVMNVMIFCARMRVCVIDPRDGSMLVGRIFILLVSNAMDSEGAHGRKNAYM
jgi:hypothetical protein